MRTKDIRMAVERRGECIFTSIYVLDTQCHGMKRIEKEKGKEGRVSACCVANTKYARSKILQKIYIYIFCSGR
jgi:hypothetical protein